MARDNKHLAEIHTFGVGSGASPQMVIELAEATGGTFTFADEGENIKPKVIAALNKASQPTITEA